MLLLLLHQHTKTYFIIHTFKKKKPTKNRRQIRSNFESNRRIIDTSKTKSNRRITDIDTQYVLNTYFYTQSQRQNKKKQKKK